MLNRKQYMVKYLINNNFFNECQIRVKQVKMKRGNIILSPPLLIYTVILGILQALFFSMNQVC